MIIIMAGLPATGKSALARLLASELNGIVMDKDAVRAALFSSAVNYTREQDDLCMECIYMAARSVAASIPVFIDGRPFAARVQMERAIEAAGERWCLIETVCSDETARKRIEAAESHLAANRTFELYLSMKARFEEIVVPRLTVDTDQPLVECLEACLTYVLRCSPDASLRRRSDRA
jgi:adenylylsulfate kinase